MKLPPLAGIIDRRLLLNFRADPAIVRQQLPAPFRPQLVAGQAIVGICLIRLRQVHLRGLPAVVGLASENGAHRIAVEWTTNGQHHSGVYIPRRDTDSRFNAFVGNQLMGKHAHAPFRVEEGQGRYAISFCAADGTAIAVEARETTEWPGTSIFTDLQQASDFFAQGSCGYSPCADGSGFTGVQLHTPHWQVAPVAVQHIHSSYFADEALFPAGSIEFDNALLMQNTPHSWRALPPLEA